MRRKESSVVEITRNRAIDWRLFGGLLAAAVLGLLGAVYGLLKIDTWTKGYYTKRLFLGVPAVIMAIIGLIALYNDLI